MYLNNSLDNGMKEALTNNGEGLLPNMGPVGKQTQSALNYCKKEMDKRSLNICNNFYFKAKEEGQRGHRKRMHQYWMEEDKFEIDEQHLACQARRIILKTKQFLEVEIESMR